MKYNVLTYLIGEGISNIFKNKKQAASSFGTMCVIMIFFGLCFIMVGNFNNFIKQVEAEQGIQVYILNDATDDEIKKLGEEINEIDGVNTIEFVSKEEALQHMKDRFGEKAYLLSPYEQGNVLPSSYIVTLTDLGKSNDVQGKIKELEKVKRITSSDETIEMLVKIAKGVKIGSYVIIIALIGISIFIISNTIKLTVYARRKEISIMKYVGATNSFIRWPFMVEGMLIGLISVLISLLILSVIYNAVIAQIQQSLINGMINIPLLTFQELFKTLLTVYLVLGLGVGALGSAISMKKYLEV